MLIRKQFSDVEMKRVYRVFKFIYYSLGLEENLTEAGKNRLVSPFDFLLF